MADTVTIEFGAKVDALVEGVGQVREQLDGLKEHAGDLGESFTKLGEIFGIAFSIEGIKAFVEHFAELGLATERTMAMLGLTADQTLALGGVAKLTGTSMEGMALGIERMSLNIQRSTRDGTNPAAKALEILGLRSKDLIGIPTEEYITRLADAVAKFNPSLNLTNAVMAVGGRGIAQLIPFLSMGAAGFKEMEEQVRAAQEGLAAAAPGMAETHQKLTLLGLSLEGLGGRIFTVVKPAIDAVVDSLKKWVQSITPEQIKTAVEAVGNFALTVLQVVGDLVLKISALFDSLISKSNTLAQNAAAVAAGAAAGGAVGMAGGPAGALVGAAAGGAAGFLIGGKDPGSGGDAATNADMARAKFDLSIAMWRESWKHFAETMDAGHHEVAEGEKKNAAAIDFTKDTQIAANFASLESQIKQTKDHYAQLKEIYDADANQYKISQQQKYGLLIAAQNDEYTAEKALLQKEAALYAEGTKDREKALGRLKELETTHYTALIKLNSQSVKQQQQEWENLFSTISSAFNSQIRGLITGTTSWATAFKNIVTDLLLKFIEFCEGIVVKWAAAQFAQLTATQSTEAAKLAAAQASSTASAAAMLPASINMIGQAVGRFYAALSAFYAPLLGPGAPAAAAPEAAAVEASSLAYAAAESGAWNIKGTGFALLHPNEAVLPAGAAQAFRDMADGGGNMAGGHVTIAPSFQVSAIDAPGVHAFMAKYVPQISKMIAQHVNLNPSARPAF